MPDGSQWPPSARHSAPMKCRGSISGLSVDGLVERDHLGLHAEIARARADQLQAVEFALRGRQHQAAIRMQPAGLAGQRLDLAIEVDRVLLQPRDVRLAVERVHAAGRVPGRARGQLALLEQQHVGPADLGEVIEHAGTDDAATDDDGPCRSLHGTFAFSGRWANTAGACDHAYPAFTRLSPAAGVAAPVRT